MAIQISNLELSIIILLLIVIIYLIYEQSYSEHAKAKPTQFSGTAAASRIRENVAKRKLLYLKLKQEHSDNKWN